MAGWVDDRTLQLGDTQFFTLGAMEGAVERAIEMAGHTSTPERFLLQKPRVTVDRYLDAIDAVGPRTIVELGVFKGGSTALFARRAQPDRLIAFELASERVDPLDRWISEHGLSDQVHVHYGIDQADVPRIMAIVDAEVGPAPLDMVFDDASHALGRSRRSFNSLFPRLRPGGLYVIEDWGLTQRLGLFTPDKPPMSLLMMEIMATLAVTDGLIDDVTAYTEVVFVRRGPAELPPSNGFDVGDALGRLRHDLARPTI